MINVEFENRKFKSYDKPVKIKDLIEQKDYRYFACKVNNKLKDFEYVINKNCRVNFVGLKDSDASRVYECSLRYVLLMAAYRVDKSLSLIASFNVSRSTLIKDKNGRVIDEELFNKIKEEMENIIKADYPFVRNNVSKEKAIEIYSDYGFNDKLDLMKYRIMELEKHNYKQHSYSPSGMVDMIKNIIIEETDKKTIRK